MASVRIDLEHEPSAVASAAFEAAPLTIFDVESSPRVSRRLADRVGAKSAAFVPVVSGARVLAVLVAASTSRRRNFPPSEIARLEALAGETALALEKTRSAAQLEEALGRERLVAEIARRVRSEHDVEAVLRVAVEEVGKATDVSRCFIRLGEPGAPTPIRAEWDAQGVPPIGAAAPNLAVLEPRHAEAADGRSRGRRAGAGARGSEPRRRRHAAPAAARGPYSPRRSRSSTR